MASNLNLANTKDLLPRLTEQEVQSRIEELTQKLRNSDIYLLLKQTALQVS